MFMGVLLTMTLVLSACLGGAVKPNFQGFAYEIEKDRVLVVYNVTREEFDEVAEKSLDEIMDLGHSLLDLEYSGEKDFIEGDQISIWIDGEVQDSYPQQAKASNLEYYFE